MLGSGGSTGIGFALAEEFIRLGANVILVARTQVKLDKAKADLQELVKASDLPGRVLTISADVSVSHEVCLAMIAPLWLSLGQIHCMLIKGRTTTAMSTTDTHYAYHNIFFDLLPDFSEVC